MGPVAESTAPGAVFISYSHTDREWLRRFRVMLEPLARNRRVSVWADEHIAVGDEWRRSIDGAVARAGLALLLVSPDFLASRFIVEEELPALLRHGVRLAPVLLRDCLYQQEPLLTGVQWAHDPGRDGPIAAAAPRERDGRIVRVCKRLV